MWWHPDAPGGGEVDSPGMIIDSVESERPVVKETLEAPGQSDNPNHSISSLLFSFCICIVHETIFVLQFASAIVIVSAIAIVSVLGFGYFLYHSAITAAIIIFIIIIIIPTPLVSQNPHSFARSGLDHHLKRHG